MIEHVKGTTVATLSPRIKFVVKIREKLQTYAYGDTREWSCDLMFFFDGRAWYDTSVSAATPPGQRLETADDTTVWAVLNLATMMIDVLSHARSIAREHVLPILAFGEQALSESACTELGVFREIENEIQRMRWTPVPGQVIVTANEIKVGDVIVERPWTGGTPSRFFTVDTMTRDTNSKQRDVIQFVDAGTDTLPWYTVDALFEILPSIGETA